MDATVGGTITSQPGPRLATPKRARGIQELGVIASPTIEEATCLRSLVEPASSFDGFDAILRMQAGPEGQVDHLPRALDARAARGPKDGQCQQRKSDRPHRAILPNLAWPCAARSQRRPRLSIL
ncbi:MAG: hypothetical protein JST54_34405 [Deltaproteobacteria bacterium]|nr:hypothetical protein [Deltaproteobacteria bacterium]